MRSYWRYAALIIRSNNNLKNNGNNKAWIIISRSQWPRGLRLRSAADNLLRLWVWIPPGSWMFVCCECCVSSGSGLCDELITRPEESYRLWCGIVCDLETSWKGRPWPVGGCCAKRKKSLKSVMNNSSSHSNTRDMLFVEWSVRVK